MTSTAKTPPSLPSFDLTLLHETAQWKAALPELEGEINNTLSLFFTSQKLNSPTPALSVVLADDAFVQDLNQRYRGKDNPTNVLSFPSDPEDEPDYIGDVIFAFETLKKEAHEQQKTLQAHFTHLLIHGCLHLLGYDHIEDAEAQEMEALEIALLQKLGIANPYEER